MENTIVFFNNTGVGRKSKYEVAKEWLLEKYINNESVEISELAKALHIAHSTARNYLLRFHDEELNQKIGKYYNYKR